MKKNSRYKWKQHSGNGKINLGGDKRVLLDKSFRIRRHKLLNKYINTKNNKKRIYKWKSLCLNRIRNRKHNKMYDLRRKM